MNYLYNKANDKIQKNSVVILDKINFCSILRKPNTCSFPSKTQTNNTQLELLINNNNVG